MLMTMAPQYDTVAVCHGLHTNRTLVVSSEGCVRGAVCRAVDMALQDRESLCAKPGATVFTPRILSKRFTSGDACRGHASRDDTFGHKGPRFGILALRPLSAEKQRVQRRS